MLKQHQIPYKFEDSEFIIESNFKIILTGLGDNLWILVIDGVDVGNWMNSADKGLKVLLEIVNNVYFGKYKLQRGGILRKKTYLLTDLSSKKNFRVGYLIK